MPDYASCTETAVFRTNGGVFVKHADVLKRTEILLYVDQGLASHSTCPCIKKQKALHEFVNVSITGFGDNVRCHFCDGGLRNWEKDDDPWVEHARWFKRCGYLLTKKGASFIEEVTARYPVARAVSLCMSLSSK